MVAKKGPQSIMSIRKIMCTSLFIAFLLAIGGTSHAQRLHLVLAGDLANAGLRVPIWNSQSALRTVFSREIPTSQINIVEGDQSISGEWLLNTIAALPVRDGDCVFVYYMGHGSYSVTEKSHRLRYAKNPKLRRDVEQTLQRLSFTGLRCLVTDSCATYEEIQQAYYVVTVPKNEVLPGFVRLFFGSKGFLNLNSCDWGQIAAANEMQNGDRNPIGLFTSRFAHVLSAVADSTTVTWHEVIDTTSTKTREGFRELFPAGTPVTSLTGEQVTQRTQDPISIGPLPEVIGSSDTQKRQYRLGIRVQLLQSAQGVEVFEVIDGTPATRLRRKDGNDNRSWFLQEADRILQVGGTTTDDVPDLKNALKRSEPNTWIKIMDGTTGKVTDFDVVLDE